MIKTCIFCQIIRGEAPADIIFKNENFVIFLDKKPLFPGHCLLIPTQHIQTLDDLPNELIASLFTLVKQTSQTVKQTMDAAGTFIAINNKVSQSVPHLHVHIVPRNFGDGLRGFFWPRHPYKDDAEKEMIYTKLTKQLAIN